MATRIETNRRREELRHFLQAAATNTQAIGEMVPPIRELAARFEISVPVAWEVVKSLTSAGVLTTVPSVGTFIGRATVAQPDLYLLIYETMRQADAICVGFEDRVSQLGGASLVLDNKAAQDFFTDGTHPDVAGVFITRSAQSELVWELPEVRRVELGRLTPQKPHTDMVHFDNEEGGAQATRHLIQLGHRHIAFLGLHGQAGDSDGFIWSQERQKGWKTAVEEMGYPTQSLIFLPEETSNPDRDSQVESARHAAKALVKRRDISGVVAANSLAARGLFEALQNAHIPEQDWPAVVTFDTYHILDAFPISSLRLPWEEVGREGAELLYQRRQSQITGPPQQRLVPMRLISRLSCRPEWARSLGLSTNRPVLQSVEHSELELAIF